VSQADLAFVGGHVYTGDGARSRVGGVAVRAGRIIAVGEDAVRGALGPHSEVIDLHRRLLIAGFQDAHVHPIQGGLEMAACDLSDAYTADEYLRRIRTYADANPTAEWITGGGWAMEAFPGGLPTRGPVDAVVPDRPLYLPNRDHHGAWVNSRALELAGITAETPDPPDGRIERDVYGQPTGMLQEGAADLVARLVPRPTREQLREALLRAQALLHSYGITAWQDAAVGTGLGQADALGTYRDAAASGELTARVRGALWWRRGRGLEQLDELRDRRASADIGRFRAATVKIMLDGVAENHTAAMLAPYLDGCGATGCGHGDPGHVLGTSGISFIDPEALNAYVTELDRVGFQVHFHALGDRAVREALDAVAAARTANGWSAQRHHLAHLQVVHPDDVPRFRMLGAGANMQPLWAAHEPQLDELTIPYLGPERAAWQYPFGALLRAGATLVGGSDWPVTSADPVAGIHVAVNRILPGSDAEAFLPEQRLDLASALGAYTAGSAWANMLDDTGTIRIGNSADLALLDRDPFAGPPEEIASTRVLQTFVEGVRVYAAPDA
jgi:predicted amidohydrolase YtcJ